MQGFRFVFERKITTRVTFQYLTVNNDKTRSPINLTGKRLTINFQQRNADDLLMLDSAQPPDALGAKIEILSAVQGRFQIYVPIARIATFTVGTFGTYELKLHDSNGDVLLLAEGNYGVPS